ncbi:unnamed protein product [Soboliphyme baturini]|uniref:EGF-like domain-containing protein n=1 Tax=Soboliphyme baturini TaxID=241478 RepID=A0A183IH34_9BILA|nr:unnamed protein product [Soboliphyme baturini]
MPGYRFLTGWKIPFKKSFQVFPDPEIGIAFTAHYERYTYVGDKIDDVKVDINRRWEIKSSTDLKLSFLGHMLLAFSSDAKFPMCTSIISDRMNKYQPGTVFTCHEQRRLWDAFCCDSELYHDCQGNAKGSCQAIPGEEQCYIKYSMSVVNPPEPMFGQCLYNDFKRDEPCSCELCTSTYWTDWSDYDRNCGDAFRRRYRAPDKEPSLDCLKANKTCCVEVEMVYKGDCPCTWNEYTCYHGGTCYDIDEKRSACRCTALYTGVTCETRKLSIVFVRRLLKPVAKQGYILNDCRCSANCN